MKAQGYLHKQNANSGFRRQYQTYLKVRGRWAYLYRAIDRDGGLVDTMLSERRDMAAARAFFRSAEAATGITPERVTTDGHGSYPRAIRSTLGRRVAHRTCSA
jgi:transposase-like protein